MSGRSVVTLMGRLGNQLFQYSFARWLAERGHDVRFDLSSVRAEGVAPPLASRVRESAIPSSSRWPAPIGRFGPTAALLRRALGPRMVIVDTTAAGAVITGDEPPHAWWVGYWQQVRFAQTARQELIDLVGVPPPQDEIAVHVRRGDYAAMGVSQPADWFLRAVRRAREELPGAPVRIVSDDPRWCEEYLDLSDAYMVASADPVSDFRVLAQARLLVASPSTFSWWAAFLGGRRCLHPLDADRVDLWAAVNGTQVR